jgi:methylenetetrahydrofolate reductase (NADPH)
MRIADAYKSGKPVFSFELMPPRNEDEFRILHTTIAALRPVRPDFVSVTYPALARPGDRARRELTIQLVTDIKRDLGIEAMAHLTCSDNTAAQLAAILDRLEAAGIENVIALRGDPPGKQTTFTPTAGGFAHGSEFAAFIRTRWPFCVAGAVYPEGHPESADPMDDVAYAKRKQDAGVDVLITNLFFEAEDYVRFVRRARAAGVTVPIVPGVMPITSAKQLRPTGMFAKSGAHVPERLRRRIEAVAHDEDALVRVGASWAMAQCRELLEDGAPGIHFYTLNRSRSAFAVCQALKAAVPAVAAR